MPTGPIHIDFTSEWKPITYVEFEASTAGILNSIRISRRRELRLALRHLRRAIRIR